MKRKKENSSRRIELLLTTDWNGMNTIRFQSRKCAVQCWCGRTMCMRICVLHNMPYSEQTGILIWNWNCSHVSCEVASEYVYVISIGLNDLYCCCFSFFCSVGCSVVETFRILFSWNSKRTWFCFFAFSFHTDQCRIRPCIGRHFLLFFILMLMWQKRRWNVIVRSKVFYSTVKLWWQMNVYRVWVCLCVLHTTHNWKTDIHEDYVKIKKNKNMQ